MDRFVVPTDVETALAGAGFHPVEVAGSGWLAVALDGSDRRVELHVVPAVADAGLADRAARLCAVRHEHLPQVMDVVELSSGRLGLVMEHVDGLSLAQIRASRAPLADGEAATVAIPVAGALAALHDAGLAHGAVSESTILVRPDGRPVLTDLRGTLVGGVDDEADVRRLVATVLDQMPGADVHLVSDQPDEASLRMALARLLAVPALDAGRVVDACYATTEPEPVRLPDAGARASSALAAMARAVDPAQGATRREDRARRRRRTARASVGLVTAVVVLAVAVGVWRLLGDPEPVPVADDPVRAAVELTRARAAVIGSGDVTLLGTVDVPGGPAAEADAQLLAGLDGARVDGLSVDVQDAELVVEDGSRGGTTDVAVTSAMSAHSRVPADGSATVEVTAAGPRTVVLGLRWTDDGWRVWDVVDP
ncbi:hypothetical protein [Cellulomonas xylanilytica]|uniref:Protein kinase domain-containing protein n=1 Tax=Cellulomonas xylanilytica TaxID=233583 RepID=A0A510V2Z8_9CELL|nr:hypothetical protein [Cellulomonas xylanilytica]GEK19670.1 hypothetical protein CXY01_01900 [Cellulomonas xylanilytica]